MKPKVNLMILTPGHSLMGEYVNSLLATTKMLDKEGITWGWSNQFASHVADAREMTLSGTKNNNIFNSIPFEDSIEYDKLLWIDSDIAWKPEDVLRLYHSDKDIISGAYLLANMQVMWQKKILGNFYTYKELLDMEDVVEIGSTGFGFVCVKQGVFESLSRPWFQSAPATMNLNGSDYTFNIIGEDISWCSRVKDIGFKIYGDPQVKVTHHKMTTLGWEG